MTLIIPGATELPAEVVRELQEQNLTFPGARTSGENTEKIARAVKDAIEKNKKEQEALARYKIEVHFDRRRSPSALALNAGCILIWESGKRFHGGGDEKMYWCGYTDCAKPFVSEHFAYMHVVCPNCKREMFLDPEGKNTHVAQLNKDGRPLNDLDKLPIVVGERFFRLSNSHLADLLVKTFRQLESCADIYVKFHPTDIRYDPTHVTSDMVDKLNIVRIRRQPLIYPWARILKDTLAGADLKGRFLAMLTA